MVNRREMSYAECVDYLRNSQLLFMPTGFLFVLPSEINLLFFNLVFTIFNFILLSSHLENINKYRISKIPNVLIKNKAKNQMKELFLAAFQHANSFQREDQITIIAKSTKTMLKSHPRELAKAFKGY